MALFRVLDGLDAAVERCSAATGAAEERLAALQAAYSTRFPEGLSRIASLFGASKVVDAPVRLAPFDPAAARVDADAVLAALRASVGVSAAVTVGGSLEAFAAGGEGADGGDGAHAHAHEGGGGGGGSDADGGAPAAAAGGPDDGAPAPAAAEGATEAAPAARRAIVAGGEDDEEDD